jgi:CHAT domain-containing protein
MIKLSTTRAATGSSTLRLTDWLRMLVLAFPKIRVALACILVFFGSNPFGQTAFSKPAIWPSQTSSSIEGFKLFTEGQRLAGLGTRAAQMEAVDKYKAAYECFRRDNFRMGMGTTLFAVGAAYSSLGQKRRALDAFFEASTYLKELDDPSFYAMALAGIGIAYFYLSEWKPAIEFLKKALELVQPAKSPEVLGSVLCALGGTYVKLGQKQKGLEYLDRALRLAEETDNQSLEINARLLTGAALSSLGQKRKALEAAERALQIAREQKSGSSEASALMSLGEINDSLGNRDAAVRHYNEALRVGMEAKDWTGKATVLNNLASVYSDLGEIEKSVALYEQSIKVSEAEDGAEDLAGPLNGLALIYDLRAEPLKALSYYQKALALVRSFKDYGREAATLINIARVYASFNQHEQALKANNDAVAAFRSVEDPAGESTALANQGAIYTKLRRYGEAFDCLNQALELQRGSENRAGQAHTLLKIGDAHKAAGDLTEALDAYNGALALMTAVEDRVGAAMVNNNLGYIYDLQRSYQKASEYYLHGLSLARSAGDRRGEATLLGNLGFLHEKQGDLKETEALYEQAIEARERMRTTARLDEFKTEVADKSAELYSRTIMLKIKSGKAAEAFELTERARARTFLDQMNNVHIDIRKGGDPELANQEQSLRFEMGALEEKLRKERRENPRSEAVALMAANLTEKQETYTALLIRLKASNPKYAELQSYSPKPLNEIQRFLGPQTTLVSYFVTADKTLAFVVSSDSFTAVDIPVRETDLRAAIEWFRGFASLRDPQPQSLKQLHTWLIAPIRQYIKTAEVVIVPHGLLHYVPFLALTDGNRYFGDDHAISFLPSASILQSIRRRAGASSTRVLAVSQSRAEGQPVLSYADKEAASVAKLYYTLPLLTGRATKAEFMKRAPAYNIVHIAAHAELNTNSPLFSRILLSPDSGDSGAIEVREVYGMDLAKTNLVVLSACRTQLGTQSKGDDVVGLNRAFIYAGASSVIASLWTVDDEATSLLMTAFYSHLKQGMSKAAALQAAQAATRKKYAHPYYWASFVLTGDSGKGSRKRLANAPAFVDGPRRFR